MLDRQTTWIEDDEDEDEGEDSQPGDRVDTGNDQGAQPSSSDLSSLHTSLVTPKAIAGFCGRCGKIADTCYCFWNVGALAVSVPERDI